MYLRTYTQTLFLLQEKYEKEWVVPFLTTEGAEFIKSKQKTHVCINASYAYHLKH